MSVLNPSTPAFQPLSQRPFVMRPPEILIENVWNYNFVEEIRKLANLIDKYPCVAMDTEFPGIILRRMEICVTYSIRRFGLMWTG